MAPNLFLPVPAPLGIFRSEPQKAFRTLVRFVDFVFAFFRGEFGYFLQIFASSIVGEMSLRNRRSSVSCCVSEFECTL